MDSSLIIVVDDDDAVRDSLTFLLESAGIAAIAFGSGEEFLQATEIPRRSCVILDLHLPGMNGLEVLESLSKRKVELPVILITGRADASTRDRALKAGAVTMLEKPLRDQVLLDAIQQAIDRVLSKPVNEPELSPTTI